MYSIKMVGRDIRIVTPDGGEYRFNGYGDYNLTFDQAEMRAVVEAMRAAGVIATSSPLTEAILHIRRNQLTEGSHGNP